MIDQLTFYGFYQQQITQIVCDKKVYVIEMNHTQEVVL